MPIHPDIYCRSKTKKNKPKQNHNLFLSVGVMRSGCHVTGQEILKKLVTQIKLYFNIVLKYNLKKYKFRYIMSLVWALEFQTEWLTY